jgi:hypothetical protein
LHDRFMALAPEAVTAPKVARLVTAEFGDDARVAGTTARMLDRVAFDRDDRPTDADRTEVARGIADLEQLRRHTAAPARHLDSSEPVETLSR